MPHHHTVKVSGKVTDIFGHRFIVETSKGNVLADIGPKAAGHIALKRDEKVELEGEGKPTEIKVHRIAFGGRPAVDVHHSPTHKDHHDDDHPAFSAADARRIAERGGFKIVGELCPHKKHYEAKAEHEGKRHDIHIHRNHIMMKFAVD